jgi:biopolymer transport protein ExbB
VIDLFLKGGPVMWPLLGCAVVGLAFIIERLITYALAATNPKALVVAIEEAYNSGGSEKAVEVCEKSRSPVARILSVALRKVFSVQLQV